MKVGGRENARGIFQFAASTNSLCYNPLIGWVQWYQGQR